MGRVEPDTEALRATIRARGLRATGARLSVLRHLSRSAGPRSHGDVADALADDGFDRATVFRNLNDLTAAGLLTRFDAGDRVWRFEIAPPHGHAHFICTDCGGLQCLEDVDVKVAGAAPASVAAGDVHLQIRGVCDGCG